MIVTIISTILVTNSMLSLFCSLIEIKKKNQTFRNLLVWQTRNSSAFCLLLVTLYFRRNNCKHNKFF